jgi:hypothetical protein
MVVLRQQIKNHGHQQNDESNATAMSPGPYGNSSINTPPGRRINRWRFYRFLQPERQGGGFLRTTYYDPSHLHLAIPSTHPSPIRSLTAPIFFDCTPSIAQRASEGWLPTKIGLGSCAPIDVYSTEQSSIDAVYNSISATEDVTGEEECTSSKGGHKGGTGEFQGCDHNSTQTEQS